MTTTTASHAEPSALRTSMKLVARTSPYLLLNIGVYFLFFLAVVLWWAVFGGVGGFFLNRDIELIGWLFLMVAFGGPWALLRIARRYVLYLVKGAHIATVTAMLLHTDAPRGGEQIRYGRDVVQRNFRDVSILFAVDQLVAGVLRGVSRTVLRFVDFLPLPPGATSVAAVITAILSRSLTYIDEAILSYSIAQRSDNVWRSARHGVVLYAQAYQPILKAAAITWLVGRLLFFGVLLILALPAAAVVTSVSSVAVQAITVLAVLLLASLTLLAVLEPFAMTYTLVTYHRTITGLEPHPEWDQRLQTASDKFRELVGKAREAGGAPDPLDAPVAAGPGGAPVELPPTPVAPPPAPAPVLGALAGTFGGGFGRALHRVATATRPYDRVQPAAVPSTSPGDDTNGSDAASTSAERTS